jgi:hypothetical protein
MKEIEQRAAAATAGPWHWHVATGSKNILLESNKWVVMAFTRYGMSQAAPEFRKDGILYRADELTKSIPGYEHHKGFDEFIDHPDAIFIEHAKGDVEFLISEVHRLTAELKAQRERAEAAEKRAEAAIEDISETAYFYKCMPCVKCKHDSRPVLVDGKIDETSPCRGCSRLNNHFEWRGEKGEAKEE